MASKKPEHIKYDWRQSKWYETLFPMTKYYKLDRPIFVGPYGVVKFWEVSPIVAIVGFVVTAASLYYTLYYPLSRGECLYTKTPGYRKIDLENPPQWKFIDFIDYKTYKPLKGIKKTLQEMACEEYERLKECELKGIDVDTKHFKINPPNNCSKK